MKPLHFLAVFLLVFSGCGETPVEEGESQGESNNSKTRLAEKAGTDNSPGKTKIVKKKLSSKDGQVKSTRIVSKSFSTSDKANKFSSQGTLGARSRRTPLVETIWDYALDSQAQNPTVVIWVLDISSSNSNLLNRIQAEFTSLAPTADDKMFESVLVTFGSGEASFVIENPMRKQPELIKAIEAIGPQAEDGEATFVALGECVEKYGPMRRRERKSVMLVLVTDEAGGKGTAEELETETNQVLAGLQKYSMPLFVLGNPAPFGRSIDAVNAKSTDLVYGPETAFAERVRLGMWDGSTTSDRLDSGFGPWNLERLCRGSGGRFLANRTAGSSRIFSRMQSNWPGSMSMSFEPSVMSAYKPFYGSLADYRKQLSQNKAKNALHQAAKLPYSDVFRARSYEFAVGNESQLVREINSAQRMPAVIRPGVEKMYDLLRQGEGDRDKLESKRWQASFDLAYGRVMANYVRVVGINSMLAELKGGKAFEDSQNNRWMLQPGEEVLTGSSNRKLAEKAKTYLQRVIDEHPGTPWAAIAEIELRNPMGWTWKETRR